MDTPIQAVATTQNSTVPTTGAQPTIEGESASVQHSFASVLAGTMVEQDSSPENPASDVKAAMQPMLVEGSELVEVVEASSELLELQKITANLEGISTEGEESSGAEVEMLLETSHVAEGQDTDTEPSLHPKQEGHFLDVSTAPKTDSEVKSRANSSPENTADVKRQPQVAVKREQPEVIHKGENNHTPSQSPKSTLYTPVLETQDGELPNQAKMPAPDTQGSTSSEFAPVERSPETTRMTAGHGQENPARDQQEESRPAQFKAKEPQSPNPNKGFENQSPVSTDREAPSMVQDSESLSPAKGPESSAHTKVPDSPSSVNDPEVPSFGKAPDPSEVSSEHGKQSLTVESRDKPKGETTTPTRREEAEVVQGATDGEDEEAWLLRGSSEAEDADGDGRQSSVKKDTSSPGTKVDTPTKAVDSSVSVKSVKASEVQQPAIQEVVNPETEGGDQVELEGGDAVETTDSNLDEDTSAEGDDLSQDEGFADRRGDAEKREGRKQRRERRGISIEDRGVQIDRPVDNGRMKAVEEVFANTSELKPSGLPVVDPTLEETELILDKMEEANAAPSSESAGRDTAKTRGAEASVPSGRAVSAAWLRAAMNRARQSFSTDDGWKVLEMNLDEGEGTVTIKARQEADHMAVSVGFSDPDMRALAQANADRLQEALQSEYETSVDLSLFSGDTGQSQQGREAKQTGNGLSKDQGTGEGAAVEESSRSRRPLPAGAKHEWVG